MSEDEYYENEEFYKSGLSATAKQGQILAVSAEENYKPRNTENQFKSPTKPPM